MSELRVVEASEETVDCEVCVLGAGIAGLNALFAASRHVSARDKLVIVDRRPVPTGMWNSTYDYVRLHQAHPMFTAGNIRWRDQPDPYHLATREEVVGHLQHCFEQISKRAALEPRFGYSYVRHEEGSGDLPVTVSGRSHHAHTLQCLRDRPSASEVGPRGERARPYRFVSVAPALARVATADRVPEAASSPAAKHPGRRA